MTNFILACLMGTGLIIETGKDNKNWFWISFFAVFFLLDIVGFLLPAPVPK